MYLIPCNDNCIYQKDGCCFLEFPSVVTNSNAGECMYYVKDNGKNILIDKNIKS